MPHGPEEQIEHAEHAEHAAHDPFYRRVAMTIAIVAAVLACVTMMSHRAHNATLRYQAEANRLQTEANIKHTEAADQWSFFQAKNIRNHEYRMNLRTLAVLAKDPAMASERETFEKDLKAQLAKYKTELPKMQEDAEALVKEARALEARGLERLSESEKAHHRADRFDWGQLAVEFSVVLCSVAVLTKLRGFWFTGIAMGILGAAVALSAFTLH
ncbi:hypothetical protein AYO40_02500 [Planctomycetaceae bacterium SCGC AG-212-D15]|nr:hypothetical protein AYO40_02500 [Planctomycetaceae bacterium SCGC AG-212-D15]